LVPTLAGKTTEGSPDKLPNELLGIVRRYDVCAERGECLRDGRTAKTIGEAAARIPRDVPLANAFGGFNFAGAKTLKLVDEIERGHGAVTP